MPQTSFRTPSSSTLDQSQDDPGKDAVTPYLNFVWKKEGRIGKDMTCYLTGKSTDLVGKKAKKSKEPDIAIALFSGLKEMSIMEPNLYRVEMEDYKGLEVVLLLGAAVIRDLFFGNPREAFHIIDPTTRNNSGGLRTRKGSSPVQGANITPPVMTPQPPRPTPPPTQVHSHPNEKVSQGFNNQRPPLDPKRASLPPLHTGGQATQRPDPHSQRDVDAQMARLNAHGQVDEQERKRREEASRRARRKAEEEEERQRKHEEKQREKERRRKQAEVDKETERLRKQFGDQSNLLPPARAQQRHSAPLIQQPFSTTYRPSAQQPAAQRPPAQPPRPVAAQPPRPAGPYLHPPRPSGPATSSSSFFSNGLPKPDPQKMKKKSFWGLRSSNEDKTKTLHKKQSSMF
jgi:hypothetical protein